MGGQWDLHQGVFGVIPGDHWGELAARTSTLPVTSTWETAVLAGCRSPRFLCLCPFDPELGVIFGLFFIFFRLGRIETFGGDPWVGRHECGGRGLAHRDCRGERR